MELTHGCLCRRLPSPEAALFADSSDAYVNNTHIGTVASSAGTVDENAVPHNEVVRHSDPPVQVAAGRDEPETIPPLHSA
jgi:hypothetical protein